MYTNGGESKETFPYELVQSYDVLERVTELPEKSKFWSTLKKKNVTDEEYEECRKIWDSLPKPRNLLAFMQHYCIQDSVITLKAAKNMAKVYFDEFEGIDVYKTCLSILSFKLRYLFDGLQRVHPTVRFGLMDEDQANLHQELFKSICAAYRWLENGSQKRT